MDRTPVRSSTIAAIGHDTDSRVLEVEFNNGAVYCYYEVPPSVEQALMSAASCGKYLNANIKGVYRFEQIS